MTSQDVWTLARSSANKWNEHNAPRLSAALAYYTLLSLAPAVVLIVLICGLAFSRTNAELHLLDEVNTLAGQEWVTTVRTLIDNAQQSRGGVLASVIAIMAVLFGSSSVFVELRDSLNTIWDAPAGASCVGDIVRQRIASFAAVLSLGVLALLSTVLDVALQVLEQRFAGLGPLSGAAPVVSEVANLVLSLVVLTALFGLIFKFVPDVPIDWRDVGMGAGLTAILFIVGRTLLAFYFAKAAIGSAFGAAGSLVAFVAWIYYCAQIFFFGAVVTRVYAIRFGSRLNSGKNSSTAAGKAKHAAR